MRVFVDTNVFIAVIEESDGSEAGRKLLNKKNYELCTSYLNIIEVRDVLMKKKRKERSFAEEVIEFLLENLDTIVESAPNLTVIDEEHRETLMDPMDCVFHQMSVELSSTFVSLERELQDHGAKDPADII
jgi:predicted nucleic-acid-binding protein